jgi:hypothetical protein
VSDSCCFRDRICQLCVTAHSIGQFKYDCLSVTATVLQVVCASCFVESGVLYVIASVYQLVYDSLCVTTN